MTEQDKRHFDASHLENLRADESLDYFDVAPKQLGILEKIGQFLLNIGRYISDFLMSYFNIDVPPSVFDFLVYAFMVVGLVYLILKIVGADLGVIFTRDSKSNKLFKPHTLVEENLQNIDFEKLILDFANQKNWTLAIRYCYLHTLKVLTDRGLIDYQLRKTNSEYFREIQNVELASEFRRMSTVFEQVWYGRVQAAENQYEEISGHFHHIKSLHT